MVLLDPSVIAAFGTFFVGLAALVWAIRRKPKGGGRRKRLRRGSH